MKVSDYVIEFLIQKKIDKVFGYIGGNNAHLFDSIDKYSAIELVNSRHEQGAGFASEGYARATLKTGISTVTSGPGATNLVTPIASCFLDSIPSLFIVGDINSFERDTSRGMRQIGFQDIDIVSIVKPITKYAVFIDNLKNLRYELEKAYFLTQEGRKGPVLISLPVNLQYQEQYEPEKESSFFESQEYLSMIEKSHVEIRQNDIIKAIDYLEKAKRPVVLAGHGVTLADANEELSTFLNKTKIPLVHSLMGKDVIDENYPYNLGFIGRWGNRYGNLTLANSDCILVLGSRVDTLQTGRNVQEFAKNSILIQVDIDSSELGKRVPIDLEILGDVKNFLKRLNQEVKEKEVTPWNRMVHSYKEHYPHTHTLENEDKVGNQIVSYISECSRKGDIFTIDVGEHQMLSAQALGVKPKQRVLFTGGLGSMGFALPASIGATLGAKERTIVISGDGGMQMNIQELEVISSRELPIKIFILNNASLHMVSGMQDSFLNSNYVGTKKDYSAPNFNELAKAYKIKSSQVSTFDDIKAVIKESLSNDDTEVIEILLSGQEMTVSPLLDYARPYEDMYPYLSKEELKRRMSTELA